MKRLFLIGAVLSLWTGLLFSAVQTPIYPILADKGIAGEDIYIWGPSLGDSVLLSSTAINPPTPEGQYSMRAQTVAGAGSTWAVMFLNPDRTNRAVDLSAYNNGEIRFWANCNTDNFFIGVQNIGQFEAGYDFQGAFGGAFNQWLPVSLPIGPLSAVFPINALDSPFLIEAGQNGTCYIDNVRYVNPPSPGADIFTVAVKNISNQQPATNLTWPGVSLPRGWVRSDQYIELQTDVQTLGWGIQIYTNNTSAGASPKFVSSVATGQPGSDPAGLVDASNTGRVLPMAWSVKAGTQTAAAAAPQVAEPNNNGIKGPIDNNAFQWLYMKDLHTPTIAASGTTAFLNGDQDPYVVVKNYVGNHFGQSPTEFGAENTPNYIYLEANFNGAVTPRTYQTTTLTLEFFYQ